jgi:hypothetical protein
VRVTEAVESDETEEVAVMVRASGRWPTGRVQEAVNDAVSPGAQVRLDGAVAPGELGKGERRFA